ncbi:TetR/AcrR family transcriptional regulator [Anoxybacterium hadale]|uniref:TetR/AcrR family transcriptional regulator n=1 Tax=Anoxybacterium hadale TaxID=3408580 RepID=A0ACD1A681_9FIRM|nr:TetR/AcrR family transcriptional regulator [Clostridiales bacterium]
MDEKRIYGITDGKTKKSMRTQARIISSYLDLMQEKHFEKITVKELVLRINITRGTFYLYFNDIYELQQHIETDLLESFQQFCLSDKELFDNPKGVYSDWGFSLNAPPALSRWFEYCDLNKKTLQVLLGPNGDPYFVIKLRKLLWNYVNRLMDSDHMPHDQQREYFLMTFVELNLLLARQWLNEKSESSLTMENLTVILNTMRVGANCLSHYNVQWVIEKM